MALETLFSQCITEIMTFQAVRLPAGGRASSMVVQVVYFPKTKAVNEGSNQDLVPLANHRPCGQEEVSFSTFNIQGDNIRANGIPKEGQWFAPKQQLYGF